MAHAIKLAKHAANLGEVPIGALLVRDNEVLSEAWNQPISDHDPTAHAEIMALRKAALQEKNYRLPGSVLYVTLEPCLMCFGALIQARVKRVVYGAADQRFAVVKEMSEHFTFNHQIEITAAVLQDECAQLLTEFFKSRRKSNASDIAD